MVVVMEVEKGKTIYFCKFTQLINLLIFLFSYDSGYGSYNSYGGGSYGG